MPPPAYEFRGNNGNDKRSRPKHEFTFRYPRPTTAERPLLMTKRETTPELLIGAKDGEPRPLKFAPIDDITDSDETDMDVSSDEDGSHPRKKRALGTDTAAAPAPKWSNPDPYTVLPPPDESQVKRKDVVKMIRKARLAAAATQAPPAPAAEDAVTSNQDFISLAFDEEEEAAASADAPKGPKNLQGKDPALGNRKRTHDDEIKSYPKKPGKLAGKFYSDGSIIDQWRRRPSESGTPWMSLMEPTLHLGTRSVLSSPQRFGVPNVWTGCITRFSVSTTGLNHSRMNISSGKI